MGDTEQGTAPARRRGSLIESKIEPAWWKPACIYQVYPASFRDTTGSGVGDLKGIIEKLDYIHSIGVDAIWVCPFYESPAYDMGYDISDYQKPDPSYGTSEDVDALIQGCHERGLKIIFDLDLHRWFQESRKSKDNPFRKYYIWRPPRKDENGNRIPPTNWTGAFGEPTWTYDEQTDEYYFHFFTKEQPDLDWSTEEVRDAIFAEAIEFWQKKGVDGWRVDACGLYFKPEFKDVPVVDPEKYHQPAAHLFEFDESPELLAMVKEMNRKAFAKYNSVTIAELGPLPDLKAMLQWVQAEQEAFSMTIRFDVINLDHDFERGPVWYKPIDWVEAKRMLGTSQQLADPQWKGWLCNYLENHDHGRSISRFTSDAEEHRDSSAKMLAIHLVTLSGTLLIYQGEEIGMSNVPDSWSMEEYVDPATILHLNAARKLAAKGSKKYTMEDAELGATKIARDHSRTPMQWSAGKNAGFSDADKTWMRVNDDYKQINVAEQEMGPDSVLNFWRTALKLRLHHMDTFVFGHFELCEPKDKPHPFCYTKRSQNGKHVVFVALNFSEEEQPFEVPAELGDSPEILVSSLPSNRPHEERTLRPYEGRVYANLKIDDD